MNMTNADKKKMAEELTPFLLNELSSNTEMIVHKENKASKVAVRLVDSGKVSDQTRLELKIAEDAIESASSLAELKAAAKQAVSVLRTIVVGR